MFIIMYDEPLITIGRFWFWYMSEDNKDKIRMQDLEWWDGMEISASTLEPHLLEMYNKLF